MHCQLAVFFLRGRLLAVAEAHHRAGGGGKQGDGVGAHRQAPRGVGNVLVTRVFRWLKPLFVHTQRSPPKSPRETQVSRTDTDLPGSGEDTALFKVGAAAASFMEN